MADERTSTDVTATEFLRQQHAQVKFMFEEMDRLQGDERRDLFDCLRATLAVHETAEEEVVHPEARSIDGGEELVRARLHEEGEAKRMLSDLEKLGPDHADFAEKFAELKVAVLAHAEAEENEVFPLLDANVPSQKLRDMTDALAIAEQMAPTHPHPHGPESALGNLLLGPFVAMADKVRDKIREHRA